MGAVQQYIDLYRSQKDLINNHSSAVMNGLREEAVALLESRGLPSLKDEEHRVRVEALFPTVIITTRYMARIDGAH